MADEWQRWALCREYPELPWVPSGASTAPSNAGIRTCVRVCEACPVVVPCYQMASSPDFGFTTPEGRLRKIYGVFGGVYFPYRATKGRPVAQCGTNGGFDAHKRRGEVACEACKKAHRLAQALRDEKLRTRGKRKS